MNALLKHVLTLVLVFCSVASYVGHANGEDIRKLRKTLPRHGVSAPVPDFMVTWNQASFELDEKLHLFWSHTFPGPSGSSFLSVHFAQFKNENDLRWSIKVKNGAKDKSGLVIQEIDSEFLTRLSANSFWTTTASGNAITIEVWAEKQPSSLSFKIDKLIFERRQVAVKSYMNEKDPKIRDIADFKAVDKYYQPARSIAKLTVFDGDEVYPCTGFLIGDDLLMTNFHCLPEKNPPCPNIFAEFGYETKGNDVERVVCTGVGPSSEEMDFATLRLKGSPGTKWGHLNLSSTDVKGQPDSVFVAQHPDGRVKHIAIQQCRIMNEFNIGKIEFPHSCDTVGGSSGSPIIDEEGLVIGLHHAGFAKSAPVSARYNRGIRASAIYQALK